MEERARFVLEANHSWEPFESLCARYGISRKTGYKWLRRYDDGGLDALRDLSRRPRSSPHATPEAVVELLLDARRTHQTWGPRKLIAWLDRKHPDLRFPAPGTVGLLLKRHGLVKPRRRVRRIPPYGFPLTDPEGPGDVFCADFKGQFRLGNRKYCYPLTMTDQDSRYLLCCDALESTRSELTLPIFERVFREHGLPLYMRTDNGAPFSSRALAGLSKLGVWLIKLGVTPERIEVGKPQQNGRHERMHRTLKAETTRPPAATMKAQQRVFDRFRGEYNDDRPHEALGQNTPSSAYQTSPRPFPARIPDPEYPAHWETKRVYTNGTICLRNHIFNISSTLSGEVVGLQEVDDDSWLLHFFDRPLALLDTRKGTSTRLNRGGPARRPPAKPQPTVQPMSPEHSPMSSDQLTNS